MTMRFQRPHPKGDLINSASEIASLLLVISAPIAPKSNQNRSIPSVKLEANLKGNIHPILENEANA